MFWNLLLLYLYNKGTILSARGLSFKAMPSNVLMDFLYLLREDIPRSLLLRPGTAGKLPGRGFSSSYLSLTPSRSHFLTQNAEYASKLFTNIVLASPYSLLASWVPVSIGAETSSKNKLGEDKKRTLCFSVDFQEKRILSFYFLRQPLFTALPSLLIYFQMERLACLNENLLVTCHKIITFQIYIC